MPIFKDTKTGKTIEVSEDHASQVMRKQRNTRYVEVEEPKKVEEPKAEEDEAPKKPVGRPKKYSQSGSDK